MFGGAVIAACAVFAVLHGTVKFRHIEILNDIGSPAMDITSGKNGEARINFYDRNQVSILSIGSRGLPNGPLAPYESFADGSGRNAVDIAVDGEGESVIAMSDHGIKGRLVLGRIHWEDSGPSGGTGPALWGLQMSGNPGYGRKFAGIGLLVADQTAQEVNLSEPNSERDKSDRRRRDVPR
jgi:hypothetical protein